MLVNKLCKYLTYQIFFNGKDKCDLAVSYFLCPSFFLYPLKYKKRFSVLFSGGMERGQWLEKG